MSFVKKAVKKVFSGIKRLFKNKIFRIVLVAAAVFFTAGVAAVGFGAFSGVSTVGGFFSAVGSTMASGASAMGALFTGKGFAGAKAAGEATLGAIKGGGGILSSIGTTPQSIAARSGVQSVAQQAAAREAALGGPLEAGSPDAASAVAGEGAGSALGPVQQVGDAADSLFTINEEGRLVMKDIAAEATSEATAGAMADTAGALSVGGTEGSGFGKAVGSIFEKVRAAANKTVWGDITLGEVAWSGIKQGFASYLAAEQRQAERLRFGDTGDWQPLFAAGMADGTVGMVRGGTGIQPPSFRTPKSTTQRPRENYTPEPQIRPNQPVFSTGGIAPAPTPRNAAVGRFSAPQAVQQPVRRERSRRVPRFAGNGILGQA